MAKRFQFRLNAVLKVRQHAFEEARRVVADRLRRVARIKERIAGCRAGVAEAMEQSRQVQSDGASDVVLLRQLRSYAGTMQQLMAEAEAELRRENEHLREEQHRLAEAHKNLKVIEKLRERQWERHCLAEQRREQSENDEVALQLHRRLQEA